MNDGHGRGAGSSKCVYVSHHVMSEIKQISRLINLGPVNNGYVNGPTLQSLLFGKKTGPNISLPQTSLLFCGLLEVNVFYFGFHLGYLSVSDLTLTSTLIRNLHAGGLLGLS